MKIKLDDATVPQLKQIYLQQIGDDVPKTASKGWILSEIRTAAPGIEEYEIPEVSEATGRVLKKSLTQVPIGYAPAAKGAPRRVPPPPQWPVDEAGNPKDAEDCTPEEVSEYRKARKAWEAQRNATMIRLQINPEDKPGGQRPVEVCVNGTNILIPRGELVEVPWPYAHALNNARVHVYEESNIDPRVNKLGGLDAPKMALAYPVAFLDPLEVAA